MRLPFNVHRLPVGRFSEINNELNCLHTIGQRHGAENMMNTLNLFTPLRVVLPVVIVFLIALLITASRRLPGIFREVEVPVKEAMGEMEEKNCVKPVTRRVIILSILQPSCLLPFDFAGLPVFK